MSVKWYSVNDKLPESNGFYLVVLDDKYIDLGKFYEHANMFSARDPGGPFNMVTGKLVTHWAELPPLPEILDSEK